MSSCGRNAKRTLWHKIVAAPSSEDYLRETVDDFTMFWLETDWFKEPEAEKSSDAYFNHMWEELYSFRLLVFAHYEFMHPALKKSECDICGANDEFLRLRNRLVWRRKNERLKLKAQTTIVVRPPTPHAVITAAQTQRASLSIRGLARRIQARLHLKSFLDSNPSRDCQPRPELTAEKVEGYKSLDAQYCEAYFSMIKSVERKTKQFDVSPDDMLTGAKDVSSPNSELADSDSNSLLAEIKALRLQTLQRRERNARRNVQQDFSEIHPASGHFVCYTNSEWLNSNRPQIRHTGEELNHADASHVPGHEYNPSQDISFDVELENLYRPARTFLQTEENLD